MVETFKEKILQIERNKTSISEEDLSFLLRLQTEYPYFQLAYYLYLLSLKKKKSPSFDKFLSLTASLTTDRTHLYELINQPEVEGNPRVKIIEEATEKEKNFREATREEQEEKEKIKDMHLTYLEWVSYFSSGKVSFSHYKRKSDKKQQLIEKFLQEQPKIKPVKNFSNKPLPEVQRSVEENVNFMTETLANLYIKQGKYEKAIQAFEILRLKYPEKNRYFAIRIEEVKTLMKDKK